MTLNVQLTFKRNYLNTKTLEKDCYLSLYINIYILGKWLGIFIYFFANCYRLNFFLIAVIN